MKHEHEFKLQYSSTYSVSEVVEVTWKCSCGKLKIKKVKAARLLKEK